MRTPRLDRDRQQWVYDYVVKESGRVFHWDEDGRQVPKSVKSHAQISKHLGRIWDGFGTILGWLGGVFGTISRCLLKNEFRIDFK